MLLGLLLTLLAQAPSPPTPHSVTLTILQTSDLHGRVHPHDSVADRDLGGSLSRVASAVRTIRAEGRPMLLLDSGDTIQGAPEQAVAFAANHPDPIVAAMNLVGYDAMALGNHEFDFGIARTRASKAEARFPWLSANTLGSDGRPAFDPYTVKTLAGVRVGILGLTTASAGAASPTLVGSVSFEDPAEAASRWVPVLREKEKADLVVIVIHEGLPRADAAGGGGDRRGRPEPIHRIAEVPGVDLILMGHTHVVIRPMRIGSVWAAEPGRWGEALTRFDVSFAGAEGAWRVTGVRGMTLPMRRVAPDAEVRAVSEPSHAEAMRELGETAAILDVPVPAADARRGDSAALDWVHEVQLREGRAELSFAAMLPGRPPEWPAGPLSVREIWSFYPYENSLVTLRATGQQVREALEWAASRATDPRALSYDCDTLEGADYALDFSRPAGHRVVSLSRGGRPVGDADTFVVALNSFRAAGGGGYGMWRRAERLSDRGNLRDMLIADARARKHLALAATGNWKAAVGE
ncbi:MAG TPA: bifunctional UDP-sugar hydrolase/5'-nucleotidase [Thermoanaerobaculia bacterium]|jgi:2',3'-cyclic-nucleotide 2'-phosphodiesterase/3'-nucleotidase|nr:bifunctional UDP-sugar hydrolase/5'-nucleotidase [Thermoanaerobaculia bacterium]